MAGPTPTERLLLRPLRTEDAQAVCSGIADWEVMRWLSQPPWPYALQDATDFIRSCAEGDPSKTTFAITLEDLPIGVIDVRVKPAGRSQRGAGPNLGYWLGQPYWGRGYMTEAASTLVAHVFARDVGDTIYSGAFADNAASLRVQEKLGFVRDGETTLYSRPRSGHFPHINTRLTRSAFEARIP
jgi:RimJ/RimL family protein N-acetyltransferase